MKSGKEKKKQLIMSYMKIANRGQCSAQQTTEPSLYLDLGASQN